jgi:hypothetical protein
MIISFTTFQFNVPEEIPESDYEGLKEVLTKNPDCRINPPYPFKVFLNLFKVSFIMMGIGIAGFILNTFKIPELIVLLSYLVGLAGLLYFVGSQISFLKFLYDKSSYYSKLKNDIIRSISYSNFQNLRKNKITPLKDSYKMLPGKVLGIVLLCGCLIIIGFNLFTIILKGVFYPGFLLTGIVLLPVSLVLLIFPGGKYYRNDYPDKKLTLTFLWKKAPLLHRVAWIVAFGAGVLLAVIVYLILLKSFTEVDINL